MGYTVNISHTIEHPWCVMWDFTTVLHQEESSGLQEFYYVGAFFSWTNKLIWSRTDRALHNGFWYDMFDFTYVTYQAHSLLDHTPIILDFPNCLRPKRHSYSDAQFKDIVKHTLDKCPQGPALQVLKHFLCNIRNPLNLFNTNKFADIYAQQGRVREALMQIQTQLQGDPFNNELLHQEDIRRQHYVTITHSAIALMK
ncbi:hypothetical protein Cgig2_011572 [Carnegiea gigantea]|uniref:Uncharacterized protein n=1 Tax=Carnegiea gigantea TaxID=171969 RepID=A0A9Q1GJV2_9CARY|nr:hypothetical protein Cgig2_011572 [Carnegiea gigantea]